VVRTLGASREGLGEWLNLVALLEIGLGKWLDFVALLGRVEGVV
jgi:hypothetical protein